MKGIKEITSQPIPRPSLIGIALTVSTDEKLVLLVLVVVTVISLCCAMESVSIALSTNQFTISPVPSQVNVAVVKGGTVTDTGGTVMTKRN